MRAASIVFGSTSLLFAQTYRQVDGVPLSTIEATLVADQTISARQFAIQAPEVAFSSGDHSDQLMFSFARSMAGSSIYYGLALNATAYAVLFSYLLGVFGPTSILFAAADMGAAINTQTRYYEFFIPVNGNYSFVCFLKGDIDFPRNRVILKNYSGQSFIEESHQLGGNETREYTRFLPRGGYIMSVGLGSGSSVILHTAGSLSSVRLNESATRSWTFPVIVAKNSISVPDLLPNIGSTAEIAVDFTGFPPNSNENCIDADPFVFSNLRPGENAILRAGGACTMTRYTTIGCQITRPTLSNATFVSWNGNTAIFRVTRGPNEVLTVDPP